MLMVALGGCEGGRAWEWGWWRSGSTLPGGFEPQAFQGEVWFSWVVERAGHTLSPQLCCLHADMLASLGSKEAKKGFLDFYHSFLEKTAVRHLPGAPVPPALSPGEPPCSFQPPPYEGQPGPFSTAASPQTTVPRAPQLPPITAKSSASLHSFS